MNSEYVQFAHIERILRETSYRESPCHSQIKRRLDSYNSLMSSYWLEADNFDIISIKQVAEITSEVRGIPHDISYK